jgi:hypothetical protein
MLYTPDRHEPLPEQSFTEAAAHDAIARITARAEHELDASTGLWPRDPADAMRPGEGRAASLYWGAAGIAWALAELGNIVDRDAVDGWAARLLDDPDDPDFGEAGLWFGAAGALAVAESLCPDASRRDKLADLARGSLDSPALEPMVGHPGYMTLAAQLQVRTGEERWSQLWSAGAERLWAEWRFDDQLGAWLWTQHLGNHDTRYLGAAHGLVGNLHVLRRGGGLLPADQGAELERRSVDTLSKLAVAEDGRANWPAEAGGPLESRGRIRVQWCHGAPGVLTAMWDAAREDEAWSELLLAAGRLVYEAGPIRDEPGLCHGTAGNAYALLALWRRTGDEEWLERARTFALHAARQVEERAGNVGRGRHSLFTGDEGVALCLASCIIGDERFPIADRLLG